MGYYCAISDEIMQQLITYRSSQSQKWAVTTAIININLSGQFPRNAPLVQVVSFSCVVAAVWEHL